LGDSMFANSRGGSFGGGTGDPLKSAGSRGSGTLWPPVLGNEGDAGDVDSSGRSVPVGQAARRATARELAFSYSSLAKEESITPGTLHRREVPALPAARWRPGLAGIGAEVPAFPSPRFVSWWREEPVKLPGPRPSTHFTTHCR
jgi:hypothetical protein